MAVCAKRTKDDVRGEESTHDKVLLIGEHEFRSICIISAIGLVDNKFVFLLEMIKEAKREHDNGNARLRTWEE